MNRTSPSTPARVNQPGFAWTQRDWLLLAVGVAIVWLVFYGPPVSHLGGIDLHFGLDGPMRSTPWHWVGAILLIVVVLLGEHRSLASLLLTRPSWKDLDWALTAFGCGLAWTWLATTMWPDVRLASGSLDQITSLGVIGVLIIIVTAAVTEEIVFRGYLAERVGALARSRVLGAAVSLVISVAPHVAFFGPAWLLLHLSGTLAIAAVVLLRRNLWAGMLAHLCVNLPILILTIAAN